MIAVDTSVWIDFFRGRPTAKEKLSDLLDRDEVALPIPVKIEILSGAKKSELQRLEGAGKLVEKWVTAGVGDLLVAAVAVEHDCTLWSLDSDFMRMASLRMVNLALL